MWCDSFARDYAANASRQGQVLGGAAKGSLLGLGIGAIAGASGVGQQSEQLLARSGEVQGDRPQRKECTMSLIKTAWRDGLADPRRSKCKESEMGEVSTKWRAPAILLAGVLTAGSAHAQNQPDRTIEQFKCKDVMREPDQNRAVAIAFLHGYLLGKSGDSKFNVDVLEKQTDAFIEQCLDNPQTKAEDVMLKLKN
jgi:hypothetical protein